LWFPRSYFGKRLFQDGWTVKEWMEDVISKVVLAHVVPRDYPTIPDERLRADYMEERKRARAELRQLEDRA
jgi:hypothetical protein